MLNTWQERSRVCREAFEVREPAQFVSIFVTESAARLPAECQIGGGGCWRSRRRKKRKIVAP